MFTSLCPDCYSLLIPPLSSTCLLLCKANTWEWISDIWIFLWNLWERISYETAWDVAACVAGIKDFGTPSLQPTSTARSWDCFPKRKCWAFRVSCCVDKPTCLCFLALHSWCSQLFNQLCRQCKCPGKKTSSDCFCLLYQMPEVDVTTLLLATGMSEHLCSVS